MGVEVMTSTRVTKCDAGGVDSRPAASMPARSSGPPAWWPRPPQPGSTPTTTAPAASTSEKDLSVPGHPEIFVVGDTAAVADAKGRPVPGIAPRRQADGHVTSASSSPRALPGSPVGAVPLPPSGRSRHHRPPLRHRKLCLASSCRGFIAWLFWSVAHIYFLIGLKNRFIVAFTWLWDYITFQPRRAADHPVPERRRLALTAALAREAGL